MKTAESQPKPGATSSADAGASLSYGEYVSRIGFRFFQPPRRPWRFYRPRYLPPVRYRDSDALTNIVRRLDLAVEMRNTRLPGDAAAMRNRLASLCEMPRMSTYAIAAMINLGVSRMRPGTCFVNVGVWHGFTLFAGMAGNPDQVCIGVDNFSEFGGPRDAFMRRFQQLRSPQHHFFDLSYQDYFSTQHKAPIGFYIYDGEHSYEHQLEGMRTAEPFFSRDCLILVDDTNLPAPREAVFDFVAQSRKQYRVLCDRRTQQNLHPTLWNGVIVLQSVS
jgi:hypothetical protein